MFNEDFPILSKYLEGKTYAEIGEELGVTRERVRQKISREKKVFFSKNPHLKENIGKILKENGFFFSCRKNNKLLRLLRLLGKEEGYSFATLLTGRKKVFLVLSSVEKEDLSKALLKIKSELSLPLDLRELYGKPTVEGYSPLIVSLFLKLFQAVVKDRKLMGFKGLTVKENFQMFQRSKADLQIEEITELLSVSPVTVRKTLKELGVLRVKRRAKGFNRKRLIAVNVTEEEYRKIKEKAELSGYSISSFVRNELKRIGVI